MLVHNLKSIIKISKLSHLTHNLCHNCGIRNYCGSSSRLFYKNLLDSSIRQLHQQKLFLRRSTGTARNGLLGPRKKFSTTPKLRKETENKRVEEIGGNKKDIKFNFKKKDIKRLLLLAKDEKWTIAGEFG